MKKTMKEIWNSQAMKKFIHNKKAMLGLAIVTILVLAVVFIPLFADLDPYTTDRAAGFNKPPSVPYPGNGRCGPGPVCKAFIWRSHFPVCRDHLHDHLRTDRHSSGTDRRIFPGNSRIHHYAYSGCIHVFPVHGTDPGSGGSVWSFDPYGNSCHRCAWVDGPSPS